MLRTQAWHRGEFDGAHFLDRDWDNVVVMFFD
jgi:hypothetical protein